MTTTVGVPARTTHLVRCTHCPGVIAIDGETVHDHHPSCSYWSLRCRICEAPITGSHAPVPPHDEHEELCFLCGDLLEVESHP